MLPSVNSGATNGAKKSAVKPVPVKRSGVSNQPLPSACHTKKPDSGYAGQKAVIGRRAKKNDSSAPRVARRKDGTNQKAQSEQADTRKGQPTQEPTRVVVAERKPPCPKSRQREKSEEKTERRHEPTQHGFWYWPHIRLTGPEHLATTQFSQHYYCRHRCALPSS